MLAIDPGVNHCGVAIIASSTPGDSELTRAFLWKTERPRELLHELAVTKLPTGVVYTTVSHVVIEKPQVYVQSRQKGDPNDLIDLAVLAGQLAGVVHGRLGSVVFGYRPSEWKKQVPKKIHRERIKSRLTKADLGRVELPRAQSLAHNVWDAIGLGLYHLKCIDRRVLRRSPPDVGDASRKGETA